jgi:1-acyl-sn-glycerol-3-phosphate acyltransferase
MTPRTFLFAAWFYSSLGWFGIPALPFAALSRGAASVAARLWAGSQRLVLSWLGVTTVVRGMENIPAGACLIAMKHQSTYDTIGPFFFLKDPAFVLKTELLSAPVFGWYCKRMEMIPIDRDGGAKTMRQMLAAAKVAAGQGRPIIIFPEGTRQDVGAPPDYKPGVAGIYRALNLPCIPLAVNTGMTWSGGSGVKRITPGRVVFEALAPIEPGLSREAFMARLEQALEPATARLVAEELANRGETPVMKPA